MNSRGNRGSELCFWRKTGLWETWPIPYICDSKKKTQITISDLTLVSYAHQGAALIFIPCALTLMLLFNISIGRHYPDRLGCTNNLFCEITHQMAHSNLGLAVVFAPYLVVAGHKRKVSFFFFFFFFYWMSTCWLSRFFQLSHPTE